MSTASSLHYATFLPNTHSGLATVPVTAPHREILALQEDLVSPNLFFLQDTELIELIELGPAP
jgi:hypothetical protein